MTPSTLSHLPEVEHARHAQYSMQFEGMDDAKLWIVTAVLAGAICYLATGGLKYTTMSSNNGQRAGEAITKPCSACGKKLARASFSKRQWTCRRERRCKACVEHQLVCEQLKQKRKSAKKERKNQADQVSMVAETEVSGAGHYAYVSWPNGMKAVTTRGLLRGNEPPGSFFASSAAAEGLRQLLGTDGFGALLRTMAEESAEFRGTFRRTEYFTNTKELPQTEEFLLACGILNDINLAKRVLPETLHLISPAVAGPNPDGSSLTIADVIIGGCQLNALEWAAKRGNYKIAEWLATDPRTNVMVTQTDSTPVAWACYNNKLELARMLIRHGANSHATTNIVFGWLPPTHLAAVNGKLLALKFLVEECGHDISERDSKKGLNIRQGLRYFNEKFSDSAACMACDEYAESMGVSEYACPENIILPPEYKC